MAHSVIGHTAEKLTRTSVIQARTNLLNNAIGNNLSFSECLASPNGTSMGRPSKRWCGICCWLVLPKGGISQGIIWWILLQVVTYVFELPFSRAQETEADEVCSSSSKGNWGRVLSSLFIIVRLRVCKICVCHDFTFTSQVGLLFAAKACFDVREAPAFWGVMQLIAEVKIQHLQTASTYRLTNKGWGWGPGGPGPGGCGNFGFCINPPGPSNKAG